MVMEKSFNKKVICIDNQEPLFPRWKLTISTCTHSEDKFTNFATEEFQTGGVRKRILIVSLELHSDFKASGVRKDDF